MIVLYYTLQKSLNWRAFGCILLVESITPILFSLNQVTKKHKINSQLQSANLFMSFKLVLYFSLKNFYFSGAMAKSEILMSHTMHRHYNLSFVVRTKTNQCNDDYHHYYHYYQNCIRFSLVYNGLLWLCICEKEIDNMSL